MTPFVLRIMAEKQLQQDGCSSMSKADPKSDQVMLPPVSTESKKTPKRTPSAAAGSARQLPDIDSSLTQSAGQRDTDGFTMRSPLVDPGTGRQQNYYPMPMANQMPMGNPMFMGPGMMGIPMDHAWEDDDGEDYEDDAPLGTLDPGHEPAIDVQMEDDLLDLGGGVALHDDKDGGPEVSEAVANVMNDMWEKGRNSEPL